MLAHLLGSARALLSLELDGLALRASVGLMRLSDAVGPWGWAAVTRGALCCWLLLLLRAAARGCHAVPAGAVMRGGLTAITGLA